MTKSDLQAIAVSKSEEIGVDHNWVLAVITIESNFNTFAIRYEPHYKYFYKVPFFAKSNRITEETEFILQASSIGLMQVMGGVARELNYLDNLLKLTEPRIGIHLGCVKLKSLIKKYGYTDDAIASYNAGSPRFKGGKYINQYYVDKFKGALNDYRSLQ